MAETNTEVSKLPKQISNLDQVASDRYIEKLNVGGVQLPDPYSVAVKRWDSDVSKWASVLYPDIYNYLINYPGLYTAESLKAYKSLDGYNYFHCGHVQQVLYHELSKESTACLLKTKVTPTQRVNDKPHETWVCIDKKGGHVISAHCNCKAGKKVQPKPVDMINFDNPKPLRKKRRRRVLSTSVENDDGFDAAEALRSLKRICPSACILTKGDSDTDTASEDEDLPPVEHESLSPTDLEDKCQRFVRDFQELPQQVMNLEAMTKGQQDSVLWQRQRRGRITATTAHDVLTLKQATTKSNVLKKIMKYHECDLLRIDALKFGRQHE
ncbi:hypothetical protein MAR_024504 [Mya arenaria]|uniref:Uncharacterized protein n=1 Tax=Mya arenaria TaxID=6604 RepID=A0ABY7DU71_MYAAR|nr:hypothetical protein MAR_024504 [Mya arenaria]